MPGYIIEKTVIEKLISEAISNRKMSYAPYSHFNVSAALLSGSGKIYKGINVENAAYGSSICAERSAIVSAVSAGERKIEAIAIVGGPDFTTDEFCPPCGSCRQVMREFADPKEMIVILAKSISEYKVYTLEELLPLSFGPENMGV